MFIAGLAALVGTVSDQRAVFWLAPVLAVPTLGSIVSIPGKEIDHRRARDLDEDTHTPAAGMSPPHPREGMPTWRPLLAPGFLVLAGLAATFHFVNVPVFNMVAQKLALAHPGKESALTSAAVVIGQVSAIPAALLLAQAGSAARTPLPVLALAALPLRCLLFAATDDARLLLAGQVFDGFGGGLFDALLPLLLADRLSLCPAKADHRSL